MLADFVLETCNNPGTGATVSLLGAATDRKTFASAFSSGANAYYYLDDGTQAEWGYGVFTAGSPSTITRGTVLGNTAGTTSRLNFSGTTRIYNELPAAKSLWIDQNGKLTVNANTQILYSGATNGLTLTQSGSTATNGLVVNVSSASSYMANWYYNSTQVGSISTSGSAVLYNTTSDYRLKLVHGAADGGLIEQVRVHDAAFRAAPDQRYPMLLAHELAEVAPFAVHGEKDAVDDHGEILPQQVDHSKLVPALIAYCQGLERRIAMLEDAGSIGRG